MGLNCNQSCLQRTAIVLMHPFQEHSWIGVLVSRTELIPKAAVASHVACLKVDFGMRPAEPVALQRRRGTTALPNTYVAWRVAIAADAAINTGQAGVTDCTDLGHELAPGLDCGLGWLLLRC